MDRGRRGMDEAMVVGEEDELPGRVDARRGAGGGKSQSSFYRIKLQFRPNSLAAVVGDKLKIRR
jgi:hypothetical protein